MEIVVRMLFAMQHSKSLCFTNGHSSHFLPFLFIYILIYYDSWLTYLKPTWENYKISLQFILYIIYIIISFTPLVFSGNLARLVVQIWWIESSFLTYWCFFIFCYLSCLRYLRTMLLSPPFTFAVTFITHCYKFFQIEHQE